MNRRCLGGIFCILAVLLYITKFIVYAIIISSIFNTGVFTWTVVINDMQPYIGGPLTIASVTSLLIGISFIIFAEINFKNESTN